jgi:hypothetical protein
MILVLGGCSWELLIERQTTLTDMLIEMEYKLKSYTNPIGAVPGPTHVEYSMSTWKGFPGQSNFRLRRKLSSMTRVLTFAPVHKPYGSLGPSSLILLRSRDCYMSDKLEGLSYETKVLRLSVDRRIVIQRYDIKGLPFERTSKGCYLCMMRSKYCQLTFIYRRIAHWPWRA